MANGLAGDASRGGEAIASGPRDGGAATDRKASAGETVGRAPRPDARQDGMRT